ncbi:hypothetical protein L198_04501 [Cryptococcus wingfieldii CBS 7118]|uniref:Major facilitator superfamily (MFS) profile domain-containing protein n=1 Tax=Cryptococcus wingfieldii CBS 7118 TaxID=1295528 RepID=A0A1E3J4V5_9TREE|nr:hypothetical protein L198_04501 [Cryptococcus wingfieldii CBS 7118]ODN95882.1 hypothetical protein L198_04501 [Cryptococcus wingfieldii CBS 7118]
MARQQTSVEIKSDIEAQYSTFAPIPDSSAPIEKLEEKTIPEGDAPAPAVPATAGDSTAPDGGYGWVIVACYACCNAGTWGVNTTYGVYSSYYLANNYFSGGSTLRYAWVGGLSVAVALTMGPVSNYLTTKFGFRIPYALGALCVVLGQCMAGICTSFGTFLVCQGVIFGLGLGLTMIPVQPLMAHWFHRRLALTQGIAACGSGAGGLLMANTTRVIIEKFSVKWALIVNGLISAALLTPGLFLFKGRHKQMKARQAPLEFKWLWHQGFVWVWLWGAFTIMSYFIAIYSLASFATHAIGLSQTQGAALQSILSAGQMIGRPLWGYFLDTGGRVNLSIICYIICGLSTLCIWLPSKNFGLLIFYALVQGMTGGTIWSAATPVAAKVVGVQHLASALSMFWLSLVIPALVGQPIAIALLNYSTDHLHRTGPESYYISIGLCGGMSIVSALLLYGSKRWLQGSWKLFQKT